MTTSSTGSSTASGAPRKLVRKTDAKKPLSSLTWPALRFRLLDELGEPMDIGFRRLRLDDGAVVDREDIRHEDHDGVGGFTALLEDRGFVVDGMPTVADPTPPGFLQKLLLLRAYLGVIRGWPQRWRREPDWTQTTGGPAPAVAYLDVATTSALVASLKASQASVTAGVVAALDAVAAAALLAPDSPRRWMVPVNMRTSSIKVYENVVTSLLLPFPSSLPPSQVQATLKDMLARRFHWGTTLVSALFSRLSHARLRRSLTRFDPRKTIFGYVSNVGVFPGKGVVDVDGDDASSWAVLPPVGRRGPLASVLLTYRGRLSVSLHAHGCLGLDDAAVRDLLAQAMARLLRDAGVDGSVDGGARVFSTR